MTADSQGIAGQARNDIVEKKAFETVASFLNKKHEEVIFLHIIISIKYINFILSKYKNRKKLPVAAQ